MSNSSSYRSSSLKKRITDYCKDKDSQIMILPQKGQSSIICSSHLPIGLLLSNISSLKDQSEAEEYAEDSDDEFAGMTSVAERNIML